MTSPHRELPLTDRVALVTGAGRGLGAAIALRLAADGADVVVNDLDLESARATAAAVEQLGRRVRTSGHDVSDHAAAGALAADAVGAFGRVDVLVNNAGITRDALLTRLEERDWDDVVRVDLKGPFNVGQAVARHMIERKRGRIINIASLAWMGNVGQSAYAASKAGVLGLTRTWALELAKKGIQVNAVAPGFIDTAMTRKVPAPIREQFIRKIPLGRIGEPSDIADVVAFLASDGARYISGQCIQVDGALSVGVGGVF
jgi:NAD(P)-dependent dehydrogenase (short-subunit alcohol dehydrogenase family)